MYSIPEKHFIVLEYCPASFKLPEQLWNCLVLNYWLHWTFKNQDLNNVIEHNNVQICSILNSCVVKSKEQRLSEKGARL